MRRKLRALTAPYEGWLYSDMPRRVRWAAYALKGWGLPGWLYARFRMRYPLPGDEWFSPAADRFAIVREVKRDYWRIEVASAFYVERYGLPWRDGYAKGALPNDVWITPDRWAEWWPQ